MGTASGSVLSFYVLQKNIKSATGPFSEHISDNRYITHTHGKKRFHEGV
jgi:hypothetical protein